jgi:hypothetical protein
VCISWISWIQQVQARFQQLVDETVGIMLVKTIRALLQDLHPQLAYRDGAAEHVLLNTI